MCPLPVTKEQRLFCRRKRQWSQSSRTLLVNVVTGGSELWFKLKFILLAVHSATNPCSPFPIWERTWCARGLTLQISGLICGVGIENEMNIEGYTVLIQIFCNCVCSRVSFGCPVWVAILGHDSGFIYDSVLHWKPVFLQFSEESLLTLAPLCAICHRVIFEMQSWDEWPESWHTGRWGNATISWLIRFDLCL